MSLAVQLLPMPVPEMVPLKEKVSSLGSLGVPLSLHVGAEVRVTSISHGG